MAQDACAHGDNVGEDRPIPVVVETITVVEIISFPLGPPTTAAQTLHPLRRGLKINAKKKKHAAKKKVKKNRGSPSTAGA